MLTTCLPEIVKYFLSGINKIIINHKLNKFGGVGKNVNVRYNVVIYYPQKINIGNFVDIGEFVVLMGQGGIKIGNNVVIGNSSVLTTVNHKPPIYYNNIVVKPIEIEDNVWIGSNVVVCPGVKIGENSIIGAGAVVTKDVPPNSLWGGGTS